MGGSDVVIVGGGVMGASIALRLAEADLAPLVLERSVPGAEASSAAAGILGPALESSGVSSVAALQLGVRSRELHSSLAVQLRTEHGIDVGFRRSGALVTAFTGAEAADLDDHIASLRPSGVRVERIDGDEARRREPRLSAEVVAALDIPDEAQLDPPVLLRGLAIAAERAGARFRTGATVRRVVTRDGKVEGVELEDGLLPARVVVVAAGSWTTLVRGLDLRTDAVVPVRGQLVACETRPPVFERIVFGGGGYVVTRPDGRTLCGSTEEHVGFTREVTLGGVARIVATACRLAPGLTGAPLRGQWSSFRPGTPDGLPLIGRTSTEGLLVASGHYRNGILLAPVTAEVIRDLVLDRSAPPELEAFRPTRFEERG